MGVAVRGARGMAGYYRQQLEDINGYYGHQNLGTDLSSYVAVVGAPTRDASHVFGLTPQEVRYLKSKFPPRTSQENSTPPAAAHHPQHDISVPASSVVLLNALGYIGFKVVTTCGDSQEYLWTLERNLDADIQFQEEVLADRKGSEGSTGKVRKGKESNGKRRHSLSAKLSFLHL